MVVQILVGDCGNGVLSKRLQVAEQRVRVMERLVASARHEVNGALTPALMIAERLCSHEDINVRTAAKKVAISIARATEVLTAAQRIVPFKQALLEIEFRDARE